MNDLRLLKLQFNFYFFKKYNAHGQSRTLATKELLGEAQTSCITDLYMLPTHVYASYTDQTESHVQYPTAGRVHVDNNTVANKGLPYSPTTHWFMAVGQVLCSLLVLTSGTCMAFTQHFTGNTPLVPHSISPITMHTYIKSHGL